MDTLVATGSVYLHTTKNGIFAPDEESTRLIGTFANKDERDEIVGRLVADYEYDIAKWGEMERLELDSSDREEGIVYAVCRDEWTYEIIVKD